MASPESQPQPAPAHPAKHVRPPLRSRVFSAIRTLAAVIPLTILIWVYAEREQTGAQQGIQIRIQLRSETPDTLVRRADSGEAKITVDLYGSLARLEDVRAKLSQAGDQSTITIPVPSDLPEGKTAPLQLLPRLEDAPIFKDNGIAVKRCNPPYIDVIVDQLVSGVEVRPQLRPALAARFADSKVSFDPPVVRLRGPRSALADASSVTVYADLREAEVPRAAGEHDVASVPVRLASPDANIIVSPSVVTVHVSVKQSDTSYTIASVPVFVSGPVTILDKYRVVFPNGPFISRVTVVGPEEEIDKIRRSDFAPRATLEITSQDLRERLPRAPVYTLPPGVSVSDENKSRTIDFRLVDRSAPE